MKVFNLTDVATPVLEQRGLFQQHIAIAGRMCNPGEFVEVEDTPIVRADLADLLRIGALAIDQPPPPYTTARQIAQASSTDGALMLRQHVEVKETRVAGEPPPGPPSAEGETVQLEKHDPMVGASDPPPPAPEAPKAAKPARR